MPDGYESGADTEIPGRDGIGDASRRDVAVSRRGDVAVSRRGVCPYLLRDVDGTLAEPEQAASDDNRCVALGGPRVLSAQQQELVCLRPAHLDCPRYRRAVSRPGGPGPGLLRLTAVPRAVGVSLLLLAISAGVSFGFVLQRGGLDLPPVTTPDSTEAAMATGAPGATASFASPSPSSAAPTQTLGASATVSPTPRATTRPTARPTPRPTPAPAASAPVASGVPSASRLALLTRCPDRAGCYIYTVRAGDNLTSIAAWFGVPLATVYDWNPRLKGSVIQPGLQIRIPTPTR